MNDSGNSITPADRAALAALDARINALLPPRYQHCYDGVRPTSMGTAGLAFGADGRVAWDQIWTSFCDLALAGGPPHRGTLLAPASAEAIAEEPQAYQEVVQEIGRGIWMATGLPVLPRVAPGWVGVCCPNEAMAAWLRRAIVVENVLARRAGNVLHLPAGPGFRLAKEIKNVVTAAAKTCHYWSYHMPDAGRTMVLSADLFEPPTAAEIAAAPGEYQATIAGVSNAIQDATGLPAVLSECAGWVGVACRSPAMSVWLMRALIVNDVLVRREGNVLYLPAHPELVARQRLAELVERFAEAFRLWVVQNEAASGA